jgi:hypothetical protein
VLVGALQRVVAMAMEMLMLMLMVVSIRLSSRMGAQAS